MPTYRKTTRRRGSQVIESIDELIGSTQVIAGTVLVTKHIALEYIADTLGVTPRQARAMCSSLCVEPGVTEPGAGQIDAAFMDVRTLVDRVAIQVDRRDEARIANGKLGGRGHKRESVSQRATTRETSRHNPPTAPREPLQGDAVCKALNP